MNPAMQVPLSCYARKEYEHQGKKGGRFEKRLGGHHFHISPSRGAIIKIVNEFLQSRGLLGSAVGISKQKTIIKSLSVVKSK